MTAPWWAQTSGPTLAQGDLLRDCLLPVFAQEPDPAAHEPMEQELRRANLIVITQSCDLENERVEFVALCPINTLHEFEVTNPEFAKKGHWESVRKGRVEGLHLLASPEQPGANRKALVVDFGHIVSLPLAYLTRHADSLGPRWRLLSPFSEHFSQAFARFFMRVGLPAAIPRFER
jgi:hypothetical protein